MKRGRHAVALALGVLSIAALVAVPVIGDVAPAAAAPSDLHVRQARDVCHLPRPGNNGRVLGHDVGWSVRRDAVNTIWFFGDTYVDADNNGLMGGTNEFRTGVIARSTDNDPSDCIDLVYKTDANGLAQVALPPDAAIKECLTWPLGGVVTPGNTVYVTYTSVRKPAGCGKKNATPEYHTGLAKLTSVTHLTLQRVGILWPAGQPQFGRATKIGSTIYFFAVRNDADVLVARVPETSIEQISAYTYYAGGGSWTTNVHAAQPIFTHYTAATPNISYDATLGRFVAVYTCGFATRICARTASASGESEAALVGAWGDNAVISDECGIEIDRFRCYQAYLHDAFRTDTPGEPVYISTARLGNMDTNEKRYWVTLREYTLGSTPPPPTRQFFNSESQFSGLAGRYRWTYGTATGQALTWNGSMWAAGGALPRAEDSSASPGDVGADRIWTAPQAGTVSISGEAWIERACSTGVDLWIYQIRGSNVTTHYNRRIMPRESALTRLGPISANAGDKFVFRTGPAGNKTCDRTFWNPTITFDGAALRWSASEDFRDSRPGDRTLGPAARGYRGWRYRICTTLGYFVLSNCTNLTGWDATHIEGSWSGSGPYELLWFHGGHAPNDKFKAVAREWTAPASGTAQIHLVYADTHPCAGTQGVLLGVHKNDFPVWAQAVADGTGLTNATLSIPVVAGDRLQFAIHPGADGSNACDTTIFDPTITLL